MPYPPNPLFVGRDRQLLDLAKMLYPAGQTTAISQAATTGLGGIGKSQLAVEFAHRYGRYFPGGVFWLDMGNPANIPNEIAACGGIEGLLLPGWQGATLDEQVAFVRRAWRGEAARLLIFDNCEELATLDKWRPTTGGCRVLLTSRKGNWPPSLGLKLLHLGTLARPDSVALLIGFWGREVTPQEAETLGQIAETVGDLPLALHLVGSYLASYQHEPFGQPAAVLARLQSPNLLNDKILTGYAATHSPTAHDLHAGRTFALSLERLDETKAADRLARQLLSRAACLAAGLSIPRALLLAEDDEAAEPEIVADGLKRLVAVGLLAQEAEGYTIHRLVAAYSRVALTGQLAVAQQWVEEQLIAEAYRINTAGYPAAMAPLLPHLRQVSEAAKGREDERAAVLCSNLGYYLRAVGDFKGARPYYDRALAISERVLGPDHPHTRIVRRNLQFLTGNK